MAETSVVMDSATYLLTISSPDIDNVAMSLYDITTDIVISTSNLGSLHTHANLGRFAYSVLCFNTAGEIR